MTKMDNCPIFKGTGGKAKLEKECEVCPFKDECIEDIFNDAMAKIMEILGRWVNEQRRERK